MLIHRTMFRSNERGFLNNRAKQPRQKRVENINGGPLASGSDG